MFDFNKVRKLLQSEKCMQHKLNPKITMDNSYLNIVACCDNFKRELIEKFGKIMALDTNDRVRKQFSFWLLGFTDSLEYVPVYFLNSMVH